MGKYALTWESVTTQSDTTLQGGFILMSTGAMAEVVEFVMTGSGTDTAADTQHSARANYFDGTTTGTATSRDPNTLHSFYNTRTSAVLTSAVASTASVTVIDTDEHLIVFGFNQRGGMRWAVPQGEGIQVHGDDTDDDGFAASVLSAASGEVDGMIQWHEP